jgi:diguanylate cyclase (GGDEF)-like protein
LPRGYAADALLPASAGIMVLSIVWFVVNVAHPRAPYLIWLAPPAGAVIVTAVFARVSRTASLPAPARKFWGHLAVAAALICAGTAAQCYDIFRNPDIGGQHTTPLTLSFHGAAVVVVIWALYRLPLGMQAAGPRLRVALDAGTVVLATTVFIWQFHTEPLLQLTVDRGTALIGSAILMVFTAIAVFAVVKVALSSYSFIDRTALRMLALGMLIGSLGPLTDGLLLGKPYLVSVHLNVPILLFVAAWSGERQRRAVQRRDPPPAATAESRQSFSVLPYVAVAAVDGLLLAVHWSSDGGTHRVVLLGAVVLTGLVVLRQLTAFKDNGRLLERLDHGATHDALTQLPNRVLFNNRLHEALTAPAGRGLSVALIDLDDFKIVNDTLGHEVGDALLVAVAQRLLTCVRSRDTVARLGGDEFVVVFSDSGPAVADGAAARIIDALAEPVVVDGHELLVRASVGIADGHVGDEASDLLRQADIAMYAAKRRGGSGHLHYRHDMAGGNAEHAHLGAELRQAIADQQLFLLYQPIVALDDGRQTGVEALVRWAHPVRGALPPSEFIPLAERTGLIVPLGRWVLREACRQVAEWSAYHGAGAPAVVNVNVSARELRESTYAQDVVAALAETGLMPQRLVLEVTETTLFEMGEAVTNLRSLRDRGVRVALDDFGTGQSTLTLLQNCPVDQLKLDRSFTQADQTVQPTIAAAVIHLARALHLHVVAEGVETLEEADHMRSLGYENAQGYYFARPLPAARISEALPRLEALPAR